MIDEDITPKFQRLSSTLATRTFTVAKEPTTGERDVQTYEEYVQLTAKLLNRPFMSTAKLVEKWPLDKIIQRYELCTKHAGTMPGDVKWWWLRKQDVMGKLQQ